MKAVLKKQNLIKSVKLINVERWSCRVAGSPGCRVAGLPSCRVAELSGCRVAGLPGRRVVGLPSCRVAGLPSCRVAELPDYRVDELYSITLFPSTRQPGNSATSLLHTLCSCVNVQNKKNQFLIFTCMVVGLPGCRVAGLPS